MVNGQESSHSPKIRRGQVWGLALACGAVVAAYCLALRRYGLELADEGALLAHFDRVAHGQVPYRDFHLGYGPALYWLEAAAFAWFGASITTVRAGLALVHAGRAVLLARLGVAAGGPAWAPALAIVLVGFFLPVAPGLCVPGNIPYPAWFANLLGLVGVALLARQSPPMLTIGMVLGAAFAFKQNSGLLGLGAAAVTTVLAAPTPPGGGRVVGPVMATALLACALLLLQEYLDPGLGLVFVVPVLPLVVALGRARVAPETTRALVRLGMGFAVVGGGVVSVMVVRAGGFAVWSELLQVGMDTVRTYHADHPTLGALVRQLDGAPVVRAARLIADAAWFAVLPAVHLAAATLVATGRIRSRLGIALVAAAALGYLELYPRMDFWHLLPLVPASLVTLALVATTFGPWIGRVTLAALAVVSLGRMLPTIPVLASVGGPDASGPRIARLDLRWDLLRDERLMRLPEVIEALQGARRVGGFPALGIVNFALGTPSPWRHDYFFPGRPTPAEERDMVAALARDPPDAVVVLDAPASSFEGSFTAHALFVEALEQRLHEQRRIGPFRILVPGRSR